MATSAAPAAVAHSCVIAPDARLTRAELCAALQGKGFPIAPRTLAQLAWTKRGPPYQLFGRVALYKWAPALEWAQRRGAEFAETSHD